MQAPFTGFTLPPLLHSAVLLGGTTIIVALLYASRPPVTQKTAFAFVPWMVIGAALHVFYQLGEAFQVNLYPVWAEPLFSAPAVYFTTFLAMGFIWLAATIVGTTSRNRERGAQYLARVGIGVALVLAGLLVWQGLDPAVGPLRPAIAVLSVIGAGVLTFVIYILLGAWRTYIIAEAGYAGALVLFAHLLDGITTAVGVDILGVGERSVLPARIMEFAGTLPTEEFIGSGWLFVVVKLAVAVLIVVAFADYVSDEPDRGNLLFAFVAALGIGPAMNNVFIFFLNF
jgi:uncharacterized membrane protein